MASTFIIGRSGNQPFKITADSVSNEHARVTIDDNGVWTLEDLDSPNGTYIRNASGEFNQVYKKIISEDTAATTDAYSPDTSLYQLQAIILTNSAISKKH